MSLGHRPQVWVIVLPWVQWFFLMMTVRHRRLLDEMKCKIIILVMALLSAWCRMWPWMSWEYFWWWSSNCCLSHSYIINMSWYFYLRVAYHRLSCSELIEFDFMCRQFFSSPAVGKIWCFLLSFIPFCVTALEGGGAKKWYHFASGRGSACTNLQLVSGFLQVIF